MSGREMETVLVVCADAERCAEVVARLHDDGASVVGSAHTAGLEAEYAARPHHAPVALGIGSPGRLRTLRRRDCRVALWSRPTEPNRVDR